MSLLSPQLQAFMAIVRDQTVHNAARHLHLTQTAITQRIRTLERKLTTTLFIRTKRGMLLTPEGEALQRYCQSVKALEGEALSMIRKAAVDRVVELCICGPTSIMQSRIVRQCFPVMQKFPNLLMRFNIADTEDRHQRLRMGHCQFAILKQEHVSLEMQYKPLKPESYVLVCSQQWKNHSLEDIIKRHRIVDYNVDDQLTYDYLKQYGLFELANHERHFANRTETLASLIEAGFGYGVLTEEFSQPYLKQDRLIVLNEKKTYENKMVLAWYDRPTPPKYFSELIDAMQ
jgi:LysR family transcriptional regulator (chromosome initiation inhibitor)